MSAPRRPSSSRRTILLVVLGLLLIASVPSAVYFGPTAIYRVRKALRPPETAIVPRESSVMFVLNMERLRSTKLWAEILDVIRTQTGAELVFQDIQKSAGFNPLQDFDTVVGAYPPLDAGTGGEYGFILRGKSFTPERFEAWSNTELGKQNKKLESRDYKGHRVVWDSGKPLPEAAFYKQGTMLFGGHKWIEQMIDLEAEPAKTPPDVVVPLLSKVKKDWVLWGAGAIPEFVRQRIRADGNFPTAATMSAAYVSVDLEGGVHVSGGVVLASDQDAVALLTQLGAVQDLLRGSTQLQAAGLIPYVDAIHFRQLANEVTIDIELSDARVAEIIDRVRGVANRVPPKIPSSLPPQSGGAPSVPLLDLNPDADTLRRLGGKLGGLVPPSAGNPSVPGAAPGTPPAPTPPSP
jgi:hypothetical protein